MLNEIQVRKYSIRRVIPFLLLLLCVLSLHSLQVYNHLDVSTPQSRNIQVHAAVTNWLVWPFKTLLL